MAKKASRKRKARKSLDLSLPIYQLKITLEHIEPPIWRRFQTDDCSLDELHQIIQAVMGWEDDHLHAFVIDGEEYGQPERGGEIEHDSRSVRLSDLAEDGHTLFRYDYDFGDDWEHEVDIEQTLPAEPGVRYPRCLEGQRACPPEDCGGPYRYPYLLDSIQDPDDDEHEELLEWVGDDFDPERFTLDRVNRELRRLRPWLGEKRGKAGPPAAFAKGDLVCVKPGVMHDEYSDIPLGGWVGEVEEIVWLTPTSYNVCWTKDTLDQVHDVFFKRCRRDGLDPDEFWLDEDQLTRAAGERPTAIEPPANLIVRPLSTEDRMDRVRMVFGLTADDGLPEADEPAQRLYFDYLKARLSFPFAASCIPPGDKRPVEIVAVQALGFADAQLDPENGIQCRVRQGEREFQTILAGLQLEEDDPNRQWIEDYSFWLWEAQDDLWEYDEDDDEEEEDEDEEEDVEEGEYEVDEDEEYDDEEDDDKEDDDEDDGDDEKDDDDADG